MCIIICAKCYKWISEKNEVRCFIGLYILLVDKYFIHKQYSLNSEFLFTNCKENCIHFLHYLKQTEHISVITKTRIDELFWYAMLLLGTVLLWYMVILLGRILCVHFKEVLSMLKWITPLGAWREMYHSDRVSSSLAPASLSLTHACSHNMITCCLLRHMIGALTINV